MKPTRIIFTSLILPFVAYGCNTDESVTDAVLYEGARLITGDVAEPIENGAFVVEDGRFTAVGTVGSIDAPAGAGRRLGYSLFDERCEPSKVGAVVGAARKEANLKVGLARLDLAAA